MVGQCDLLCAGSFPGEAPQKTHIFTFGGTEEMFRLEGVDTREGPPLGASERAGDAPPEVIVSSSLSGLRV